MKRILKDLVRTGSVLIIVTGLLFDMILQSEVLFWIFLIAWIWWGVTFGVLFLAEILPTPKEYQGLTTEEVAQLLADKEAERRRKREFKKLVKKEKRRKLFRAIFDVSLPVEVRNYRDYREWD